MLSPCDMANRHTHPAASAKVKLGRRGKLGNCPAALCLANILDRIGMCPPVGT